MQWTPITPPAQYETSRTSWVIRIILDHLGIWREQRLPYYSRVDVPFCHHPETVLSVDGRRKTRSYVVEHRWLPISFREFEFRQQGLRKLDRIAQMLQFVLL